MSEDPIVVAEKLSFLFQCFHMGCSAAYAYSRGLCSADISEAMT
jgi:hypothetical protein